MVLPYSVGSYRNNLLVCIYLFYLKHLSINSTFQLTEVENATLGNSSLVGAVRLCIHSVLWLHAGVDKDYLLRVDTHVGASLSHCPRGSPPTVGTTLLPC